MTTSGQKSYKTLLPLTSLNTLEVYQILLFLLSFHHLKIIEKYLCLENYWLIFVTQALT